MGICAASYIHSPPESKRIRIRVVTVSEGRLRRSLWGDPGSGGWSAFLLCPEMFQLAAKSQPPPPPLGPTAHGRLEAQD